MNSWFKEVGKDLGSHMSKRNEKTVNGLMN